MNSLFYFLIAISFLGCSHLSIHNRLDRFPSSEAPLPPLSSQVYITKDDSLLVLPQNYQVFQRRTTNQGSFILKVRLQSSDIDFIRVQVFDAKNNAIILLAVELRNLQKQNSVFEKSLELPAGGWYRIQVEQVSTSTQSAYQSVVSNFGVGDVFVTAGQSNSTSAGEELISTKTKMVSAYIPEQNANGHLTGLGSWQLNNDPQPPESLPSEAEARASGYLRTNFGSVWPTMGDELSLNQNIPIATAETGVGGTSISQWQKNNTALYAPYTRFMETTKLLLQTTGVRMILWDQGESDNGPESLTFPLNIYGDKFKKLQNDLITDVGQKIPWMIALASFGPANPNLNGGTCDSETSNEFWSRRGTPLYVHSIIEAQEKLISDHIAFEGPNTDKYIGAGQRYPGPRGSCIHFSKSAQISVGKDWAEKISKIQVGEFPSQVPTVTNNGVLPTPALRTPQVIAYGRGCDDNLCLWFIAKNIESDFRVDIRKSDTTDKIDWVYQQDKLFVSARPDGSFAVTLRISEPEAQQALQANKLKYWIVNPTSLKWIEVAAPN